MIASYTIAQGQQVAVWDRDGRRTIVAGPRRIVTWHRRVQRVEYLKQVGGLNVDMTRFLVARHEKPDKRIRIDGMAGGRF